MPEVQPDTGAGFLLLQFRSLRNASVRSGLVLQGSTTISLRACERKAAYFLHEKVSES